MAEVRSSVVLTNRMTPVLRNITNALNTTLSVFESVQRASSQAVDTRSIDAARQQLRDADVVLQDIEDQIRQNERQQDRFSDSIRTSNRAARALDSTMRRLVSRALVFFSGREILRYNDQVIMTQARLGLIADELTTVADLNQLIFEGANRSRGEFDSLAQSVGQLGVVAGDAFTDTRQIVQFQTLLTQLFKISGAGAEQQRSAILQLNQALASGRLQGDELRSVRENAPLLIRAIADELGVATGEIKDLASQGLVTSDVIVRALFGAADEIQAQFANIPITFQDVWNRALNFFERQVRPTILRLSQALNSEAGQRGIETLVGLAVNLADAFAGALEVSLQLTGIIGSVWPDIAPIVLGVVGAIVAYRVATAAANTVTFISNALTVAKTTALAISTGATYAEASAIGAATAAQLGFNAAVLANPIVLAVTAIVAAIVALTVWIARTNDARVIWLKFTNFLQNTLEGAQLGFTLFVNSFQDGFDNLTVGFLYFPTLLQNTFDVIFAAILVELQKLINGAIGLINDFINLVNNIPGVSFEMIENTTFGTTASIEAAARVQARNDAFNAREDISSIRVRQAERFEAAAQQAFQVRANRLSRDADVKSLEATLASVDAQQETNTLLDNIFSSTQSIGQSVGRSADELALIRDLARQEIVDRFTTADITIQVDAPVDARQASDIDSIVTAVTDELGRQLAEGVEGAF